MKHFGVTVLEGKHGFKLTREKYAIISNKNSLLNSGFFKSQFEEGVYTDETCKTYTDNWCKLQRRASLYNFDLNMKFFESLSHEEFESEIDAFLKKHKKFKEVIDLNEWDCISGYYMLVLDEYKQLYIGTAQNIMRRIRQHWITQKSFDRLIFGNYRNSRLSIDSFRALDTTRIYACESNKTFINENRFLNEFSDKFICNRVGGGQMDDVSELMFSMKTRELDK